MTAQTRISTGILAIAFVLGIATARAQETEALRPGSWALQFQINDNFTLTQFQGATVSLKRHRTARSAYRLGVGLDLDAGDRNADNTITGGDTLFSGTSSDESFDRGDVYVTLQYVFYPNPNPSVNFFVGFGPRASYGWNDSEETTSSIIGTGPSQTSDVTAWSVGMSGLVGVEWFAAEKISLHAEYGVELKYEDIETKRTTTDDDRVSKSVIKSDSIEFDSRSLLFGVSVYF